MANFTFPVSSNQTQITGHLSVDSKMNKEPFLKEFVLIKKFKALPEIFLEMVITLVNIRMVNSMAMEDRMTKEIFWKAFLRKANSKA